MYIKFRHRMLCIIMDVLSALYILSSGMKLGLDQSMDWLLAIIITFVENILIIEPLIIIIIICFVLIELNQVIKNCDKINFNIYLFYNINKTNIFYFRDII